MIKSDKPQSYSSTQNPSVIYLRRLPSENTEEVFNTTRRKIFVKNMVSLRCIMVVKQELQKLDMKFTSVELGEAEIIGNISSEKYSQLKNALSDWGLELLHDPDMIMVEKIKCAIISMIHSEDDLPRVKRSVYLSKKLNHSYSYLYCIFSRVTGISIEDFYFRQEIEWAKELILYNELTLSEIAYKLHLSSVQHLSKLFKLKTGLTVTQFKNSKLNNRIRLEKI